MKTNVRETTGSNTDDTPHDLLTQQFSVQDKHVLITGGTRGIGFALAQGMAVAGAQVTITGRDSERLKTSLGELRQHTGNAHAAVLDVTGHTSHSHFFEQHSPIDVLINNAGTEQICSSLDLTEKIWNTIIDTNLRGSFSVRRLLQKCNTMGWQYH
ncbi:SDR family NAD(P)-dependent oxidoreductase [Vibrio sp. PP-XX7]